MYLIEKEILEKLAEENAIKRNRQKKQQDKQSRITQYIEKVCVCASCLC